MVAQVVSPRPHRSLRLKPAPISKIKALGLSPCSECPFPVSCAAPEKDLLGSSPGWKMWGALEQVGWRQLLSGSSARFQLSTWSW